MRLTSTDSSCDMKRSQPLSPEKHTVGHRTDELHRPKSTSQNESIRSHAIQMSPVCSTGKEAAVIFHQKLVDENIDHNKPFVKQKCFAGNECVCSADSTSPLSSFQEKKFSGSVNLSDAELLASWFFMLANSTLSWSKLISFFDGSGINPFKEASSFDETNSNVNGATAVDSPWTCSGECCQISDLDRVSYWVSLLNLEGQDCQLISETKPELDCFGDDFPSSSFMSSWSPEVLSSGSIVSSLSEIHDKKPRPKISSDLLSETTEPETSSADEPLFWPFEREFNWNSEEAWNCFSMSPLKDIKYPGTPQTSVGLKLHDKKVKPKEGCRRRLAFGSGSTTSRLRSVAKCEQRDDKDACCIITESSRSVWEEDSVLNGKLASKKEYLAIDEEFPIESLLGLNEFDGHEGIDSGFNADIFLLDESV
ncbi:Histone demethylase UTY [Quillaja saponaria]|uniref:Histone demethylase UTY n=1 Tax=Quillaja saponaria TaxID=32244 RepID=A0AAD7QFU5_QUISA|nr:Histone demethylase UTY [Quillaja saponaria]